MTNLGEYHDIYLKCDVVLLADVFERFRKVCLQQYTLDPCHFYTSPGLSWAACLKMTGISLELMTDIDQVLFIEKGIRGGISQISNRLAYANNCLLETYDENKPISFLQYLDMNNLYGGSMCEKLPTGFFNFLSEDEIKTFDIYSISKESNKGYILEVDIEYPESLHDLHSDYPLAPERKIIQDEDLSPYAKELWTKLKGTGGNNNQQTRPKVEKLLTTLADKRHYILHYRNLQLYLQLGMKLKTIHRILEFEQKAWMEPYVKFNTDRRQHANSVFERNFYKLMNCAVFGKYQNQTLK